MNIEKSTVTTLSFPDTRAGMFQSIEFAARVCTHTTDKMSSDSEAWVNEHIIKTGHGRALEFGTVYFAIPADSPFAETFMNVPWAKYKFSYIDGELTVLVTTNYRYYREHCQDMQRFLCEPTDHVRRPMLLWNVSRGIADELRTHTSISTLMESTRYCRYSANKFGGELTFIEPSWADNDYSYNILLEGWKQAEDKYMALLGAGAKAEEAREVLPLSVKTTLIQCGFNSDWDNLFSQRAKKTEHNVPHPDMLAIASEAQKLV